MCNFCVVCITPLENKKESDAASGQHLEAIQELGHGDRQREESVALDKGPQEVIVVDDR